MQVTPVNATGLVSALLLAARGVPAALLTCDETNTASVATIRACGGVLRDRVEADLDGAPFPEPKLRFDVPTTAA
mgnify:CR=1 FL=1